MLQTCTAAVLHLLLAGGLAAAPADLDQPANTWVKRSPLPGGPVSPRLGYEASLGYDPRAGKVIRWGGHNQGGGGEQNAETWTFDPASGEFQLREPNRSPPGVCCAQQNVFDLCQNRFLRFPAFSGSHGWHWFRENYLNNTTVWCYDLASNTWRDRRPLPAPRVHPLRCASWDSDHQVVVVFGGEGSHEGTLVYDPVANRWTRMRPPEEPPGRSGGNMAYSAAHGVHVLFGSQFSNDPFTWTYDLRANRWRKTRPDPSPPGDRNDAVLAYDAVAQVVVALVQVADEREGDELRRAHLETWSYDAGRDQWQHRKPDREPDGFGNRRRLLTAVPDRNVILLENYQRPGERPDAEREQQIWTYRVATRPPDQPPPLPAPAVSTSGSRPDRPQVTVRWPAAAGPVALERGEAGVSWEAEFCPLAGVKPQAVPDGPQAAGEIQWHDTDVQPGKLYHYRLRRMGSGPAGPIVSARPRYPEDGSVRVHSARRIEVRWQPPAGDDVAGYHVERAVVEVFSEAQVKRLRTDTPPLDPPSVGAIRACGPFTRLTESPQAATALVDTEVDLDQPARIAGEPLWKHNFSAEQIDESAPPYRRPVYAYRVVAVNRLGVESGPSPPWFTVPGAPEHLFAREDGKTCRLRWAARPEAGIAGYRVYRMDSPRRNGPGQPVQRLTPEPIAGPEYADATAGDVTRRYWVVAVDALGQEGIPSAPAWFLREWRPFYEPFTGPWHQ